MVQREHLVQAWVVLFLVSITIAILACEEESETPPIDEIIEDVAIDSPISGDLDGSVAQVDRGVDSDVADEPDTVLPPPCPNPEATSWQTCDGWLFDSIGRRVLLRGVNVSNARKQSPYEGGMSAEELAVMTSMGLNHIRLLTSWAAVMPTEGEIDQDYVSRIREEVERAGEYGLLVVVDSHQDIFGEAIRTDSGPVGNGAPVWACPEDIAGQFTEPVSPWFMNYSHPAVIGCFDYLLETPELQQHFADAWQAVAAAVADLPNVLGYDLWNEPYFGSHSVYEWEAEFLMPLYQRLGDAILEVHAEGILFLEPGNQKNIFGFSALPQPLFPRVVFAPHLYNPSMEMSEPFSGNVQYFENRMATDQTEVEAIGNLPIYYGEWGTPGGHDNDADFINAMTSLFDRELASWAIWQWGPGTGGYGLVDPELVPNEYGQTVARPYPERIAGDGLRFSFEPSTNTFEMSFTATDSVPTVIVVPEVRFPSGVTVQVMGGTVNELTSGRIEVVADEVGERVELTLTPP